MTRDQNMRDREDTVTLADEPVIGELNRAVNIADSPVDAFEKELYISSPEPESMTEGQDATGKESTEKDSEKEQQQHCDCCRHNAAPTMAQLAFAFAGLGRGFGRRGGGGKGFGGGPGGKHGGGGGGRHHGRFGHHRAYSPPGWEEIKDIPHHRRGGRHHEGKGGKFGRGGRCNCEREESGAIKNVDNECLIHGTENIKARDESGPRMHRRGGRGGHGYKGEGRCVCTRDGEAIKDVADDCVIHGKDGLREVSDERVECYGRMAKIGRGFGSSMPMGMGFEGHRHRGGRFEHGMMAHHIGGGHKMKGGRHGHGHGGFGASGGPGRHGHGHFRPT